mmetsp:Transcript_32055/g.84664  ORF Transcript_32055/g.84664 Transcript_32055/m.84664 type:complete len:205 (+) Transcript_32055:287-901(+)
MVCGMSRAPASAAPSSKMSCTLATARAATARTPCVWAATQRRPTSSRLRSPPASWASARPPGTSSRPWQRARWSASFSVCVSGARVARCLWESSTRLGPLCWSRWSGSTTPRGTAYPSTRSSSPLRPAAARLRWPTSATSWLTQERRTPISPRPRRTASTAPSRALVQMALAGAPCRVAGAGTRRMARSTPSRRCTSAWAAAAR